MINFEDFLKEEVRNDFLICTKTKQLWKTQMEIYLIIKDICDRNNISFFAEDGTMLGAVRHHGYIPWDDDIDLGMTRDNYEKFVAIAQNELPDGYFLQTTFTEKKFFSPIAQIRKTNTTALLYWDFKSNKNQGVFVDIFVFDKMPLNDQKADLKLRKKLYLRKNMLNTFMLDVHISDSLLKGYCKKVISFTYLFLHGGFNKVAKKYDHLCQKYDHLNSDFYYDMVSYDTKKVAHLPSSLNETIEVPFEYINIRIPKCFDLYLKEIYGENYMTPLHVSTDHGKMFIDLDKSYKVYKNISLNEFKELFN